MRYLRRVLPVVPVLLATLAVPIATHADVYKWTNDQGDIEYSDQYREGAEKITIQPLSTIQMPTGDFDNSSPSEPEATDSEPAPVYRKLSITFPENDTAFHSGSGDITVLVELQPALLPSHELRLTLDGEPVGVSKSSSFTLNNVDRGTHTLGLDVVNSTTTIQSATSTTFTLLRPSALPANRSAP